MNQKRWEKFSEEELRDIILNSFSFKECLKKLGYSESSCNNKIIRKIAEKYNLSLEHFKKKGTKQTEQQKERLSNLNKKSEVGNKYGRLTVISESDKKDATKCIQWLCKCDCGKYVEVAGTHLRSGHTQSCGCLQAEKVTVDLTNQRFGKVVALEPYREPNKQLKWKCKCDCGNTVLINAHSLKSGTANSCGCINSKGELKIRQLLDNIDIKYVQQKTFSKLKNERGRLLRFDFYLPDYDVCIEYQGTQHFQEVEYFGGKKYFETLKKHDFLKREFCQKNNIRLIEISFEDYTKLNEEYLLNIIGGE